MHRPLRCVLTAGAAALFVSGVSAQAQSPASAVRHHSHHQSASTYVTGRLADRVRLGDGLRTYQPSLHQLGVRYAPGVTDDSHGTDVHYVVDRAVLRRYLTQLAPVVRRHPVDARPIVASDVDDDAQEVPAQIVPGHDGAKLEVDAAVDVIQKAFQTDPATRHIVLPVKVTPAHVTDQDLAGIDGRIGYFVTHFNPGNVGRTMTVRKAIDIVDGTVVKPGATFSLNKVVGPRTPETGFTGKSEVFIDGKIEIQNGGGMCQVATTLFNASMLADLKITERHQHVRTIPYAPPGSDATVYYGEKDFKFTNDTGAPVYISYRTTYTHAIVAIFGKMVPGRKVKIIRHSQQLAERHFTGSISRVVYEPDGTVQRGPTFYSDYKWTHALDYNQ
jgi:vancomycin resistance protein YoaR